MYLKSNSNPMVRPFYSSISLGPLALGGLFYILNLPLYLFLYNISLILYKHLTVNIFKVDVYK